MEVPGEGRDLKAERAGRGRAGPPGPRGEELTWQLLLRTSLSRNVTELLQPAASSCLPGGWVGDDGDFLPAWPTTSIDSLLFAAPELQT